MPNIFLGPLEVISIPRNGGPLEWRTLGMADPRNGELSEWRTETVLAWTNIFVGPLEVISILRNGGPSEWHTPWMADPRNGGPPEWRTQTVLAWTQITAKYYSCKTPATLLVTNSRLSVFIWVKHQNCNVCVSVGCTNNNRPHRPHLRPPPKWPILCRVGR